MDERRIEHVRKHFRMMLQEHVTERWTVLAIGRVVRNGVGGLDFDPEFIPSNFWYLHCINSGLLRGLELSYMPMHPGEIKRRPAIDYFDVSRVGPWERIVKSKRVGIFVPSELPEAEVELIAIPGS